LHIFTWTVPFWDVFAAEWYANDPADQNVNE